MAQYDYPSWTVGRSCEPRSSLTGENLFEPTRSGGRVRVLQRPASERPDPGTQLHETEAALVTQPWQDPTLSQEPEILSGFCAAGETGVLAYGDSSLPAGGFT